MIGLAVDRSLPVDAWRPMRDAGRPQPKPVQPMIGHPDRDGTPGRGLQEGWKTRWVPTRKTCETSASAECKSSWAVYGVRERMWTAIEAMTKENPPFGCRTVLHLFESGDDALDLVLHFEGQQVMKWRVSFKGQYYSVAINHWNQYFSGRCESPNGRAPSIVRKVPTGE
jgi:hypothetical protein